MTLRECMDAEDGGQAVKCRCGKPALYHRRYWGDDVCEEHLNGADPQSGQAPQAERERLARLKLLDMGYHFDSVKNDWILT